MKKVAQLFIVFLLMIGDGYGQSSVADSLVDEGIKLHDKGDYEAAIALYTKAQAIDKEAYRPQYEMASSYLHLKKYDRTIEVCNAILDSKTSYGPGVFTLKGTAQDLSGDPKEAINTYKKGIKKFTDNYLLYYNLGYTLYFQKEYKDAEEAIQKGLILKPAHASSHLLLAYINNDQGNRMQSILALYNFLLLEPKSDRAGTAYGMLDKLLAKAVKKNKDKENSITINIDKLGKKSDEFPTAELTLGLLAASASLEENKNKTEEQLFAENTNTLFNILGETKKKKGFWANYYVDFFYELAKAHHSEALSYYVSQSDTSEAVEEWMKTNKEKTEALQKWVEAYERKSD